MDCVASKITCAADAHTCTALQHTQVFQIPYVQQHLQRYKQEEGRRYIKQSTMARRKLMLDQTLEQAANLKLDSVRLGSV